MDITRDFQAWKNGARGDFSVSGRVYDFYAKMEDASRKGPVVYERDRARRGQRDKTKIERRVVWKRNSQGRLYQDYEDSE